MRRFFSAMKRPMSVFAAMFLGAFIEEYLNGQNWQQFTASVLHFFAACFAVGVSEFINQRSD